MHSTLNPDGSLTPIETKPSKITRGTLDQPPAGIVEPELVAGLMKQVIAADNIAARFKATVEHTKRGPTLTRKGQRHAIVEAAKATLAELDVALPKAYEDQIQ